jgi:hypothetical protein
MREGDEAIDKDDLREANKAKGRAKAKSFEQSAPRFSTKEAEGTRDRDTAQEVGDSLEHKVLIE